MECIVRVEDTIILVTKYFEHEPFQDYKDELDLDEIRAYMLALMQALEHVHALGIIHRDVKPNNFLHHRGNGNYLLVDFGLAQLVGKQGAVQSPEPYRVERRQNPKRRRTSLTEHGYLYTDDRSEVQFPKGQRPARAGTRGYRAPEVLLKCLNQSPLIDVWSAGIILLTLLSGRSPFFLANSDIDNIIELAETFGRRELEAAARTFGKELIFGGGTAGAADAEAPLPSRKQPTLYHTCRELKPARLIPRESGAYDFLDQLLRLDPAKRATAAKAVQHPFIQPR